MIKFESKDILYGHYGMQLLIIKYLIYNLISKIYVNGDKQVQKDIWNIIYN